MSSILGHRSSYILSYRFRWVWCQLAVLQHCPASSIPQTLDQLPRTLDETYARVLSQIPQGRQGHAHRMMQCLLVAVRPLRVEELAELLSFEFGAVQGAIPRYRTDWRPTDKVEAVLSTCSSLTAIVDDHGSQVVQFSHFSVKEFLTSNQLASSFGDFSRYRILPGPAHTILAQTCIGFLLHLDGHVDEDVVKGFPLAEYAAKHWVTHAQFEDVASCVKEGMETLFDCDKPHFAAWVGIYNMDEESSPVSPTTIPSPLYYSSLCGFSDLVEHLSTKHPLHVNAIGGKHNYPLLAALAGKYIKAAEILLERGANVDIRGMRERTPLHEAIDNFGMVQSLLNKGADVNCQQDDLRTPLHLAAYYGGLQIGRLLAEHKADINSRDKEGKTPLYLLLDDSGRNEDDILDFARLLLEQGTGANIRTTKEWTLLHAASFWGRLEIAKLLLEHGAVTNVEDNEGSTPLHLVSEGKYTSQEHGVGIARLLLERGVDVNAQRKNLFTPLHLAAFKGRLEIVQLLLDHGANATAENVRRETALHIVSRGEYDSQDHGVSISRLLLKHGADVHAHNQYHNTALSFAAFHGRLEITRLLLDHGANPNVKNNQRETPLHIVSYNSQDHGVGIARLLLERGADVNARQTNLFTPLHSAAFRGRLEIAQLLLDHGANAKAESDRRETALHLVSQGTYNSQEHGVGIARLLLERGVDVNRGTKNLFTPLHLAAFKGRLEIVQLLLDHGARAKAENEWCETALHIVSRGEFDTQEQGVGIARLLLERGANVNTREKDLFTPLHSAALNGRLEIAQLLLDHGANAKAENDDRETALHLVSQGKYNSQEHGVGIARLLLERGVDVNAQRKNLFTPLHLAAFKGRLEIAQLLLDHGARVKAENEWCETALHIVSRGEFDTQEQGVGIARLLLERGADVNARQKDLSTPLHSAAFKGRLEIARLLLGHGANAKAENNDRETALHLVSRGEYDSQDHGVGISLLLLKHGIDVHAHNKYHDTALSLAAFNGRPEITRLLLDHGANPNVENELCSTPLHQVSQGKYTAQEHGVGIARLLLERCADVNARSENLCTPLHLAAFKGRLEIAQVLLTFFVKSSIYIPRPQVLLDHGANADTVNDEGENALHVVSRGVFDSQEQGVGMARLLLQRGLDVHAKDNDNDAPLHSAAFSGAFEIARVLLDRGANANMENKQGRTPLHQVALGKYDSQEHGVAVAQLLLERGANVHAQDKDNNTASQLAAVNGRLEIEKVLLDHGVNTVVENEPEETLLHPVSRNQRKNQRVSFEDGVGPG
jgi:ankyrin repeat protein